MIIINVENSRAAQYFTFKDVQIKFLAMHITNQKLSFDIYIYIIW